MSVCFSAEAVGSPRVNVARHFWQE